MSWFMEQLAATRFRDGRLIDDAFVHGMETGSLACAVIAFVAAVIVAVLLRARGSASGRESTADTPRVGANSNVIAPEPVDTEPHTWRHPWRPPAPNRSAARRRNGPDSDYD
jgi:hypothetical protein